jgi:TnpA family transposase
MIANRAGTTFCLRHWDDLLRLAGSLKRGWVTASLFISKLQAYPL